MTNRQIFKWIVTTNFLNVFSAKFAAILFSRMYSNTHYLKGNGQAIINYLKSFALNRDPFPVGIFR